MKIYILLLHVVCFSCLLLSDVSFAKSSPSSDEQIKQEIINDSIAAYRGNCPCPYNSARNGSRCGGRSAWNKAGGYAPLCYKSDVTPAMIDAWKKRHKS